ncbi:unnamed protein product, partial [Mesorhabditis spiculigera]
MRLILPLLCLLSTAYASKLAIFMLDLSNSQVIFNKRVAETLLQGNHSVTLIMVRPFDKKKPKVDIDPRITVHRVDAIVDGMSIEEWEKEQAQMIYQDVPIWDSRMRDMMKKMTMVMSGYCEKLIVNKDFLKWMTDEKFDVVYTHMYDFCGIGLNHAVGAKAWVWLNSGQLMDWVADRMGVPIIPSYVPPMMMESHSAMNFVERTKSFIGIWLFRTIFPRLVPASETEVFRKHISPDFPDLWELSKECPLVMVNSNELYEMARPTLHKIVNIGGLGMRFEDAKPLEKNFQIIVDSAKKGVVVFTFGSVTRMELMPEDWKASMMAAFSQFPDYQFILRYEGDDMEKFRPKNVHLHKWLPQSDLLKHPKTRGFISHGGYNSVQEALNSGQPIMTIPLFGDQPKNAKMAQQLGFGVNVRKTGLCTETVVAALKELLENQKYNNVAKRISEMVKKKPIKPEELLLKWTTFLAEFKEFENLVPYGTNLNWFVYHSLDVILFLSTALFLVFFLLYKCVRCTTRKVKSLVCGNGCSKTTDKKKKNE